MICVSVVEDIEQVDFSYTAVGNISGTTNLENWSDLLILTTCIFLFPLTFPRKTQAYVHMKICTRMFIAAFSEAKNLQTIQIPIKNVTGK